MRFLNYLRSHVVISTAIALLAVVAAVIGGRIAAHKPSTGSASGATHVSLVNVSLFRQGTPSVSANGIVQSHSQADLRSQTSAPVSSIDVSIGDSIYSGETILELQNADIQAQLDAAKASLALAQGQYSTGDISLDSAKQNVIDKIRDAYNKTYTAIVTQADPLLYNYNGSGGHLSTYSLDTALNSEISATDFGLRTSLQDWKTADDALATTMDTNSLEVDVKSAQQNMSAADLLLGDMSKLLNAQANFATPSFATTLSTWQGTITAAQSSVSGAEQALTAADMSLNTGASSQNSTAPAQISAAEAGVNNLEAQLAKTVIVSPISGKISALPLHEGELASPGTLLATVIGQNRGLLIKAYVSSNDLSRVLIGATTTINDVVASSTVEGVVSNVAPGVDPTTKEAEVDVNVIDPNASSLVIGDNVSLSINATNPTATQSSTSAPGSAALYLLPIQDVKIVPGAAYVLSVGADSKIQEDQVTLGNIQGDYVEVKSGLTDDMNIVSPVYELDPGQTVQVQ